MKGGKLQALAIFLALILVTSVALNLWKKDSKKTSKGTVTPKKGYGRQLGNHRVGKNVTMNNQWFNLYSHDTYDTYDRRLPIDDKYHEYWNGNMMTVQRKTHDKYHPSRLEWNKCIPPRSESGVI